MAADLSETIASKLSPKASSDREAGQPPIHQCLKINSRDRLASTSRSSSISSPLKTTTPRISSNIHLRATGTRAYTIPRVRHYSPPSASTNMTPSKSDQSFLEVAKQLLPLANSPSLHNSLLPLMRRNLRRKQMLPKREATKVATLRSLQCQQMRLRAALHLLPKRLICKR